MFVQKCAKLVVEAWLKREALLRELREVARLSGMEFEITVNRGKGSHYRVRLGKKFTTIKSGELTPDYIRLIKKQLEIV